MYYRYKSKGIGLKFLKYVVALAVISGLAYFMYNNKHHLMFWKYTFHKLACKIENVKGIKDAKTREEKLKELALICDDFRKDHPLSQDAFVMSSKVHFLLGNFYLNKTFSQLVIDKGLSFNINRKASDQYLKAVRLFRKAEALSGGNLSESSRLTLAQCFFYTGYYNTNGIFREMGRVEDVKKISDVDDIRFYALLSITNGKENEGFLCLSEHRQIGETVEGQLFLAKAYTLAKRYTTAIEYYRKILRSSTSTDIQKHIHINLGKIYFNQSLFAESLNHFNNALSIDKQDLMLKIWIGKNYFAMGDKTKAKAIWSEVLTIDGNNEEVKKLLKPM